MKQILITIREPDGTQLISGYPMDIKEAFELVSQYHVAALDMMKHDNADHAIYAVRYFNKGGDLYALHLYRTPVLLDDSEFYKRTEEYGKAHPTALINAIHNHR